MGGKLAGRRVRGGPGCDRLRLKGVRKTAVWERGLWAWGEEGAGRWREGFWGGGSKGSGRKRAASNASRRCLWRPDALEAALSLPDEMNPGGRTQNSSLRNKRLECPAHRVSGERWGAR